MWRADGATTSQHHLPADLGGGVGGLVSGDHNPAYREPYTECGEYLVDLTGLEPAAIGAKPFHRRGHHAAAAAGSSPASVGMVPSGRVSHSPYRAARLSAIAAASGKTKVGIRASSNSAAECSLSMNTVTNVFFPVVRRRRLTHRSRHARQPIGCGRDVDNHDGVDLVALDQRLDAVPVLLRTCRGDEVDGVSGRGFRRQSLGQLGPQALGQLGKLELLGLERIGGEDPGPPALVITPTRLPLGTGWLASNEATPKSSSRVVVRITPAWLNSASTATSRLARAPVWLEAARCRRWSGPT